MNRNKMTMFAVVISVCVFLLFSSKSTLFTSKNDSHTKQQISYEKPASLSTSANVLAATQAFENKQKLSDAQANLPFDDFLQSEKYLIDAFESGDKSELATRVRLLLESDFDLAMEIISTLDYSFLKYQMTFPHAVVAEYLDEHFEGPEIMEQLSVYLDHSSIINSVAIEYFDSWMQKKPNEQYQWIKQNSSFTEARIVEKYAELAGRSSNGAQLVRLIGELPDSDFRKEQMHQIALDNFSHSQPQAFSTYINQLEQIPEYAYDSVFGLAETTLREHESTEQGMQIALDLIDRMEPGDQYWNYFLTLSGIYKYKSPESFEQWIASHEFSFENEQQKQNFFNNIDAELTMISEAGNNSAQHSAIKEQDSPWNPFE
ncbi:hypothetical protein [Agaribacterium haliotis]|uniref:hypothetical protein n=1 Tax=Agaribacterium haliotis TaxID=2013869 RepID=UPI0011777A70|nr:hypothetical protein [Agaribacterium haliotis]